MAKPIEFTGEEIAALRGWIAPEAMTFSGKKEDLRKLFELHDSIIVKLDEALDMVLDVTAVADPGENGGAHS